VWTQAIEENNAKMESGSFSVFPRRAGPRSDEELAQWNEEMEAERLSMMEHQLTCDLLRAVAVFDKPFMTTAFIAGDMVLLHVLARQGLLSRVPVVFIDTLHLFPETYEFAEQMERHYNFKLQRFHPSDVPDLKTWRKTHGSDLYLTDPGRYDQLAKVEPLNLALGELQADAWINGRRRDHGAERASLQVFEAGSPVKVNAIAHWSFEDCWNYIHTKDVPYHPLHDEGARPRPAPAARLRALDAAAHMQAIPPWATCTARCRWTGRSGSATARSAAGGSRGSPTATVP